MRKTRLLTLKEAVSVVEQDFPGLSKMGLEDQGYANDQVIRLAWLMRYRVPVSKYPEDILTLFLKLNELFWDSLISHSRALDRTLAREEQSHPIKLSVKPVRRKYSLKELLSIVSGNASSVEVSPQLKESVQRVAGWKSCFCSISVADKWGSNKRLPPPPECKPGQKRELTIIIGRNVREETQQMRKQIISRAQKRSFIKELDGFDNEINFILNRVSEKFFDHFQQALMPYVLKEETCRVVVSKLILKAHEDHNYIDIYSRLARKFSKISKQQFEVQTGGKCNMFQCMFVGELQKKFIEAMTVSDESRPEEERKKFLSGIAMLVGKCLKERILSKHIFKQCFSVLVTSYLTGKRNSQLGSFFYEIYIELITKIIDNMGAVYSRIAVKTGLEHVYAKELISKREYGELEDCDYIAVLEEINRNFPSQRCKITFLLQDYRCKKAIAKREADIPQILLSEDCPSGAANKLKSLLIRLPEVKAREVEPEMTVFRSLSGTQDFRATFQQIFKEQFEFLMMNSSDCSHLKATLASMIHFACEDGGSFHQFRINTQDEDLLEFMDGIETHYQSLVSQD